MDSTQGPRVNVAEIGDPCPRWHSATAKAAASLLVRDHLTPTISDERVCSAISGSLGDYCLVLRDRCFGGTDFSHLRSSVPASILECFSTYLYAFGHAGAVLGTTPHWYIFRLACALQRAPGLVRDRWLLLAWLFIALGTLAKGLHFGYSPRGA